jgi:hypothetical protein
MPTLQHAENKRNLMLEDTAKRLNAIVNPLRKGFQAKIAVPGKMFKVTKETVFSMALNYGNEDNRRKLYEGQEKDGWSQRQVDDLVMKNMSKEDWDAVQAIWDLIEEFWEPIKELEEKRRGVAPAKVIAEKVETPHGVYAGGYYPVVTDATTEMRANELQDATTLKELADNSSVRAATREGHKKERVKSHGMRLRLDVGVIADHIEQVIQDLAFNEPTRELYKILDDRTLQQEMAKVLGREKVQMLKTWMVDVARGTYGSPPGWQRHFAKVINRLRQNTTLFNMGFKLTTMIMQPFGISQTMHRMGWWDSLGEYISFNARLVTGKSVAEAKEVLEKSVFMRNRIKGFDRDVRDAVANMKKGHPWFDWHESLKEMAFKPIGYIDLSVSIPTWRIAYKHAIGNLELDEQAAIDFADGIVRQTQSAGSILNLAQVQRGGAGVRTLTMFYSYFSSFYNMLAEQKRQSMDQWNAGQKQEAIIGAASAYFMLVAVPAILPELVVGRGPADEEEDFDEPLDYASWFLERNASQLSGGIVGVRDIVSAMVTDYDYAPTPVLGAVDAITKTVSGDVSTGKAAMKGLGYLTGSPIFSREAWILLNNVIELTDGDLEITPENWRELMLIKEHKD